MINVTLYVHGFLNHVFYIFFKIGFVTKDAAMLNRKIIRGQSLFINDTASLFRQNDDYKQHHEVGR